MDYKNIENFFKVIMAIFMSLAVSAIMLTPFWNNSYYLIILGFIIMIISYIVHQIFFRKQVSDQRVNRWFKFQSQWMPLQDVNFVGLVIILLMIILGVHFVFLGAYEMLFQCAIMILIGLLILSFNYHNRLIAKKFDYLVYVFIPNENNIVSQLQKEFEEYRIRKLNSMFFYPTHKKDGCHFRLTNGLISMSLMIGGQEKDVKRLKHRIEKMIKGTKKIDS